MHVRSAPRLRFLVILGLLLVGCSDSATGPPPDVLELYPLDGATEISLHTDVAVVFSEPVSVGDVEGALTLERAGVQVEGAVTVDGSTLTFRPARSLDPGGAYTATISAAVAAAGGGALGTDLEWSFATVGDPAPVVDTALIMPHLRNLAHDSMAGRGSGTGDELRAAHYIRDRFEAMGLTAAPGGWLQIFPIPEDNPDGLVGASSQNVLGVLPGSGSLADEWVIVGAHYDHEGLERVSADSVIIFNGADDNASGTALVLALAETVVEYLAGAGVGDEPRRSIMFQAYGAEELGLLGSTYYTANPVVPLAGLSGMINFDMVGRLRSGEVHVSGLWTSDEWEPVLSRYGAGLMVIDKRDCQSCSDYAPFRRRHRPAVWFFTGFHDQYSTPDDDVELINAEGLARIGDLASAAIVHLMVRADRLPFGTVLPDGGPAALAGGAAGSTP